MELVVVGRSPGGGLDGLVSAKENVKSYLIACPRGAKLEPCAAGRSRRISKTCSCRASMRPLEAVARRLDLQPSCAHPRGRASAQQTMPNAGLTATLPRVA